MNIQRLVNQLKVDEGVRLKPYRDTEGLLTVGIGRNLDHVGLSSSEMEMIGIGESFDLSKLRLTITQSEIMCMNDIKGACDDLDRNIPWWRDMSDIRQEALVNMCFNLGWPRLSNFKNMLSALKSGDYERAGREALDSKWARQVGNRAKRIKDMIVD